jgi:hypothetical protein
LKKLRAEDEKILHPKKKLVFVESSYFSTKQYTFSTHGSICKECNIPQCIVTPNELLHCKHKKVIASKNLASVNLHEKQSNTIENHEEIVVADFAEIFPIVDQQVHESSCDANVKSLFAIGDDVVGLLLMSREVTRDGTIAISTGQRCNIFSIRV